MYEKITVGLQQKIGQPNFSSLGASCSVELELTDADSEDPDRVAERVHQAYRLCRDRIDEQLHEAPSKASSQEPAERQSSPREDRPSESALENDSSSQDSALSESTGAVGNAPVADKSTEARRATEAQLRAIRAIAARTDVPLSDELRSRFGTHRVEELTLQQASQTIDYLKRKAAENPVTTA